MECSHEGIGVHTCVENSNENAAISCSSVSNAGVNTKWTLTPMTSYLPLRLSQTVSTSMVYSWEENISPSLTHLRTTSASMVSKSSPTAPGSTFPGNKTLFGGVFTTLSLVFVALLFVTLFYSVNRKLSKRRNEQTRYESKF